MRCFRIVLRAREAVIVGVAALLTIAGWRLLWFLTDDAFISFRYASNWLAGIGPTWNPPPFQHVEGYSNFSWVALLSLIWWGTGLEPPQVANVLALLFGLGSVLVSAWWLARILQGPSLGLALGLLLIVVNRSFLTWLSSGLETSLFTFLVVCWACAWTRSGPAVAVAALASLLALTRPDGLLFWAVTAAALLALRRWQAGVLIALSAVPLHLLWRRSYYGDWLPNTYYAKVGPPWPEMGVTYLLSYTLEYALYVPLVAAIGAGIAAWHRDRRPSPSLGTMLVLGCVAAQVAYYTLIVGGDHFEYRVFHHLIPLAVVALCAAWMACALPAARLAPILLAWMLLQSVIPWTHWYHTKDLYTRAETAAMLVPLADELPAPLRPVVRIWDRLQGAMIPHSVGVRHQEHKVFHLYQVALYPPRSEAGGAGSGGLDGLATGTVGVPGWVYARAAIIDIFGLNDRVLAKSAPKQRRAHRAMAHELRASEQYIACYSPNIEATPADLAFLFGRSERLRVSPRVQPGEFGWRLVARPRQTPLSEAQVRACETRAWTPDELYHRFPEPRVRDPVQPRPG